MTVYTGGGSEPNRCLVSLYQLPQQRFKLRKTGLHALDSVYDGLARVGDESCDSQRHSDAMVAMAVYLRAVQ